MNDEPDDAAGLDADGDAHGDAHIRELLAELGSGPDGRPMPPEVAARLDDTLARLVAERASTGEGPDEEEAAAGTVVPLRRRWLPRATAAAAAVIIVGAGGVTAANLGVFGNGASMSSDSGGSADSQVAESAPDASPTSPGQGDDAAGREATGAVALPRISSGSFASDVTSLLHRRTAVNEPGHSPSTSSEAGSDAPGDATGKSRDLVTPEAAKRAPRDAPVSRSCPGPAITDGAVPNPIRYDGQLAVLVIHPQRDGRQLVEAWSCSGDRRLAGTTITP